MKIKDYSAIYFLCVLFLVSWIVFNMFRPFFDAILLAAIMAGALHPLKNYLHKKYRLSATINVWLIALLLLIVLVVPSLYILLMVAKETGIWVRSLEKYELTKIFSSLYDAKNKIYLPEIITQKLDVSPSQIEFLAERITDISREVGLYLANKINSVLANTINFAVQFFIFMLAFFTFLKKGRLIKSFIVYLIPLSKKNSFHLINRIDKLNYLSIVGNGIGGVIQGGLAGLVFFLAGADNVVLWSVIMVILAFIPLIGISIIYVPYSIYLVIDGNYWAAGCIFVLCSLIALVVENIYKPKFIGRHMHFSSTLLLFGIIGGLSFFGLPGIFYGPLIIVILLFLLDVTRKTFNDSFDNLTSLDEIIYAKKAKQTVYLPQKKSEEE